MKKFVFTLLLVLGCQISLAQNSAALFDEFRREKNAEYVSASPFLMFIEEFYKLKYCSTVVYMVPRA